MRRRLLAAGLVLALAAQARADKTADFIKTIMRVGAESKGTAAARAAWDALVAEGEPAVMPVLKALGTAGPRPANWLRSALDAVAQKSNLPLDDMQAFVKDRGNAPLSRGVAFELLTEADPPRRDRLLINMTADPNVTLRRLAIELAMERLAKEEEGPPKEKFGMMQRYALLFGRSRDKDQVEALAKLIERAGGKKPDLAEHYNFVGRWNVAGPFDNAEMKGFGVAYPPEKGVDPSATYTGKGGDSFGWKAVSTDDDYGLIDLNAALGKVKGAVAYAHAEIESPAERPAEVRCTSNNAIKVFLNGERIFQREEYHHGSRLDQYVGRGTLKKGKNAILIKVCQNEQTQRWAQDWAFAARVCDRTGGAIPIRVTKPEGE